MAVVRQARKEMGPRFSDLKQFELPGYSATRQDDSLDLISGITGVTGPDDYAPRTEKTECTMQCKILAGKWEIDEHFGASLPK
jgi:hypothetical protein